VSDGCWTSGAADERHHPVENVTVASRGARPGQVALLVAVLAAGAALRPELTAVGPLIAPIRRDLGVSNGVAGLLGTIPVTCMGLFAFFTNRLLRAYGTRRVMSWSLGLVAGGSLLRSVVPGATGVLLLTVAFGVGAGVAGAALPSIVKERFAAHSMLVTGLSAIAINGAAAVSAAVAVPLAHHVGGWRSALAVFAAWDIALAGAWWVLSGGRLAPPHWDTPQTSRSPPWQRRNVWALALVFGLQGTVYYGLNAWLASASREHGWSASAAGDLVAVLNFSTLPATLIAAAVAGRRVSKLTYLSAAAFCLVLATLGIAALPAADWLWPAVAGLALGSLFPVCMSLAVDLGRDPLEVAGVSGIMLGFGYLLAALAPIALGEARDASGSFTAGMWMLAGLAAVLLGVCAWFARRPASLAAVELSPRWDAPSAGAPGSPGPSTRPELH